MAHHRSDGPDPEKPQEPPTRTRQCEAIQSGLYKLLTKTISIEIAQALDCVLMNRRLAAAESSARNTSLSSIVSLPSKIKRRRRTLRKSGLREAFGSLSHHWIFLIISDYNIDHRVIHTIEGLSQQWRRVLAAE